MLPRPLLTVMGVPYAVTREADKMPATLHTIKACGD